MLSRVRFNKVQGVFGSNLGHVHLVVDDCKDTVLGYTQLRGKVTLHYSSVCHDDVMNLGDGLLYDDSDWPSRTEGGGGGGSFSRLCLPYWNSAAHFLSMLTLNV